MKKESWILDPIQIQLQGIKLFSWCFKGRDVYMQSMQTSDKSVPNYQSLEFESCRRFDTPVILRWSAVALSK